MRKAGFRDEAVETLTGWIETETARAILFHSDFGPERKEGEEPPAGWWIPKSQITRRDELSGDTNRVEIDVKAWLVQKNGYE